MSCEAPGQDGLLAGLRSLAGQCLASSGCRYSIQRGSGSSPGFLPLASPGCHQIGLPSLEWMLLPLAGEWVLVMYVAPLPADLDCHAPPPCLQQRALLRELGCSLEQQHVR